MGEMELLDPGEGLARRTERHMYDRLIMLSDGVFAIAITLLALELRPPDGWIGVDGFFRAMAMKLAAYVISFFVVAIFWIAHRRAFANILRADGPLSVLNLIFLGFLALIPAATAMLYAAKGAFSAVEIYLSLILAIGASNCALWSYAAFVGKLVSPEVSFTRRVVVAVIAAVMPPLMSGLSFFNLAHAGAVGISGWCLMAATMIFVGRMARRLS